MSNLSDLNKKERKIKGDINKLRKQLRDKEITKREFNKIFEASSKELEKIAQEKSDLIGLPPLPPPPRPGRVGSEKERMPEIPSAPPAPPSKSGTRSPLDAIKSSILGGRGEPPKPPGIDKGEMGKAKNEKPETREKKELPTIEKEIKEIPVKEVPVIKERIKEVKVPVIKERTKRSGTSGSA